MNKCFQIYFFFSIFFVLVSFSFAQHHPSSENNFLLTEQNHQVDNYIIQHPSTHFHSSFRPYLFVTLKELNDSVLPYPSPFTNKKRRTNQTRHRSPWLLLPMIDLQSGFDISKNDFLLEKGGGAMLRYNHPKNFSASMTFLGGEASFSRFTDTTVTTFGIIPGFGIAYGNNNRYQWANFSGYVSYSTKNLFNFQLGKDKHFIGDGYRSLLLSDVANNYPYFRSAINIWNIQYACWYSWMQDIYQANGIRANFLNKFGTFHYLSWNINKNVNLSFFENIIWQGTDSNRVRGFDVNYLNPVIFFRPVEYSLGSSDNAFIGMNFSWKLGKTLKLYAQAAADEFYVKEIRARKGWWANKQGVQAGMKYINAFMIKNLTLQGEINVVRPYTYSHGSPQQSYSHFNQPLAHPFGANFKEAIGILTYRKGRWNVLLKGVVARIGRDSVGSNVSMGQNVMLSYMNRPKLANGNPQDYGHFIGQGVTTDYLQAEAKITYYLLPRQSLRAEMGCILTQFQNTVNGKQKFPFVYLAIRSTLHNFYRDFF
jgi:hypothetical protein